MVESTFYRHGPLERVLMQEEALLLMLISANKKLPAPSIPVCICQEAGRFARLKPSLAKAGHLPALLFDWLDADLAEVAALQREVRTGQPSPAFQVIYPTVGWAPALAPGQVPSGSPLP